MAIGRTNAMSTPATGKYIRPSDWLEIDSLVTAGEQKFVGLYAVFSDETLAVNGANNYLSVTITGACTINWGDGVVENYASNVKADHAYTYANLSDSTICSRGYKQAIVTITPQSGQNITAYNLSSKHSSIVNYYTSHNWLDVNVSGTHISRIRFWDRAKCMFLEKFKGYQSTTACTNMDAMFYFCTAAQYFDLSSFNTTSVTNMGAMFSYCTSAQYFDLSSFNTSSVTSMTQMFYFCTSAQYFDLSSFNTASVTSMTQMFYYCTSAQYFDLSSFNTASVTNMSYMFAYCTAAQYFDLSLFNTSSVTNMNSMFYYCTSAQYFDLSSFNTAIVTNMSNMFYLCNSTVAVNLFQTNLNSVTDNTNIMTQMYSMSLCRLPNISKTFSVASSLMTATALNDLFGDLKDLTGLTAQTITITGATGAATCNKTIATNKNWVVVS